MLRLGSPSPQPLAVAISTGGLPNLLRLGYSSPQPLAVAIHMHMHMSHANAHVPYTCTCACHMLHVTCQCTCAFTCAQVGYLTCSGYIGVAFNDGRLGLAWVRVRGRVWVRVRA